MTADQFRDAVTTALTNFDDGSWTVDELLLHPRHAMRFCKSYRTDSKQAYGDTTILRALIQRRKNPNGRKPKARPHRAG